MTRTDVPLATEDVDLIWQQCLFAFADPSVDVAFATAQRTWLDDTSWVDIVPGWLSGADLVFAELVARLPWRQREVTMWGKRVREPRLTHWWSTADGAEALPVLAEARQALTDRYSLPFDSIGCNLYRDGRDSVAWHADRERYEREDPVVAVLSTGSPRPFHLRPKQVGEHQQRRSRVWWLGQGDLLVMGGACQHDWEHCVPKVAIDAPRLSVVFRHHLSDGWLTEPGARYLADG
ncbi:MAG TPA: alpha-ketoglutarate-dependent dioxygenase AlkB [Ilumatobacteraceae bacterium]|nr:alpha-ketoglutarate-dependent dioxygenase AlkB [Ilumatobacteraceae bacterium]